MPKLSVLILCKNEEDRIVRCIRSVSWADEVLVVDAFSEDNSVQLAEDSGATVLRHEFANFAEQYNWGIERTAHEWILIVDADEEVTDSLRESICRLLAGAPEMDVYYVRRDAFFMGRRMRSSAWSNEYLPRLFRKPCLRYESPVHSTIKIMTERTGRVSPGVMYHYTYRDFSQCLEKLNRNSGLAAEDLFRKGKTVSPGSIFMRSLWRFFHNYVIRKDCLDGWPGIVSSCVAAFYVLSKYLKLRELNKKNDP